MKLYSTNNKNNIVSFKEAAVKGIADDGGLYLPINFSKLPQEFFDKISEKSFNEIALKISKHLLEDEIPSGDLKTIINDAFYFDAPLINLDENYNVLELFKGPTLAFKDFGARFMSRILSYFLSKEKNEITILVATSGDTGSAVANGFYNVEGIKVILLYPSGKVSEIQEKQLTTLDGNITALEVEGTFDDCQKLVKQAFLDKKITKKIILSSANSINIARLLPQSFYYFYAYSQLWKSIPSGKDRSKNIVFSVPSGNFGNLNAGLIAQEMGLPVYKFIAALNANDIFLKYLNTGKFEPKSSIRTISNAMDVGNPSNFERIKSLFGDSHEKIKNIIFSGSFSDEETKKGIKEVYSKFNYLIDPHGAVGYLALKEFIEKTPEKNITGIILETAHPAKFIDIVEPVLNLKIDMPEELLSAINKEKISIKVSNNYEDFREFLLNRD